MWRAAVRPRSLLSKQSGVSQINLRDFPLARLGRAEDGLDDGHVAHGIFKGNRLRCVLADGAREEVPLNRILVADGKLSDLYPGAEEVRAVVNQNSHGA